jgi:hypothetical protein
MRSVDVVEHLAVWGFLLAVPFAWCRVFFGLRRHRSRPARIALASAIAPVWPLFALEFSLWIQRQRGAILEPGPEDCVELEDWIESEDWVGREVWVDDKDWIEREDWVGSVDWVGRESWVDELERELHRLDH